MDARILLLNKKGEDQGALKSWVDALTLELNKQEKNYEVTVVSAAAAFKAKPARMGMDNWIRYVSTGQTEGLPNYHGFFVPATKNASESPVFSDIVVGRATAVIVRRALSSGKPVYAWWPHHKAHIKAEVLDVIPIQGGESWVEYASLRCLV